MNKSPLERFLSGLLLTAIVLVAANAWLAFHAEQVLAETEYWVAHTWEVIAQLDLILGQVKDAETGARGYVITGDAQYLTFHDEAVRHVPDAITHLRRLISDNPQQVRNAAELAETTTHRIALIEQIVDVRRKESQQAASAIIGQGSGLAEMNHLRTLVAAMQQEERTLLNSRQMASAQARIEARGAVAFASALDILFIIVSLWSLNYERRLRFEAAQTAGRLEKLQSISDVALSKLTVAELSTEMLDRLRLVAEIDALVLGRRSQDSFIITAVSGVPAPIGIKLPVEPQGPLAQCGSSNEPVKILGSEALSLAIPNFDPLLHTMLILPLAIGGQVIALLIAARKAERAFSPEDEQLLSVVTDRLATAIDRATLFDAEHEAREQAEASAEEVRTLNADLEERVRLRTAELEATNSELEAFSYSVSHDLRAPLRSVDGFSVALAEDYGALFNQEGKHYLARIRAGVQRMGQLIDALLQLSRITRYELVPAPISLSDLAQDVSRELAQQNPDRALDFEIEPGLEAVGDARLLRAVFENMLGNAVKFTANVKRAKIAFGRSPETGSYFIRDNGAGFDQQYVSKLFVAFQRLHGEKDFQGSGIGLASVARVIRRHHGTIRAQGVIGEGATFWFTLGLDL